MTPGLPSLWHFSRTFVVHQCRVETSVHYPSSDQKCEDYQGSVQIICGAMYEQDLQGPANCQKFSRAQTGAHGWLRPDAKRIETQSPLALQGHSRFSLRDIGTLFPIWRPWSQPELSRKLAHQIFFSCTRRTFGLNKSGWTSTRRWC